MWNLFNGKYSIQQIDVNIRAVIDTFGADEYCNNEANQIKYQIDE